MAWRSSIASEWVRWRVRCNSTCHVASSADRRPILLVAFKRGLRRHHEAELAGRLRRPRFSLTSGTVPLVLCPGAENGRALACNVLWLIKDWALQGTVLSRRRLIWLLRASEITSYIA